MDVARSASKAGAGRLSMNAWMTAGAGLESWLK